MVEKGKLPVRRQISSGGVIYRQVDGRVEIALTRRGEGVWCLPKGLVEQGESLAATALREVREETGLEGELVEKLGKIQYWYVSKEEGCRYFKIVYFYLFRCTGGDPSRHDWEVEEVRWFPVEEAFTVMSYKTEREMVEKAKAVLGERIAD